MINRLLIFPSQSPEGSYDLNSNDPDPMPHPDSRGDNHHGTRCAGEIAAVPNNSFCAVGVAYGSKVAGKNQDNVGLELVPLRFKTQTEAQTIVVLLLFRNPSPGRASYRQSGGHSLQQALPGQ